MSARLDDELRARIRGLRAQGLGWRTIARTVGVSATSCRRIVDPVYAYRLAKASREGKRRRRGRCERCGGETRYNGTKGQGVSRLCFSCGSAVGGLSTRALYAGTGASQRIVLAYLAGGERRYSDIRRDAGVDRNAIGGLLNRLVQLGLVERVSRGVYRLAPK